MNTAAARTGTLLLFRSFRTFPYCPCNRNFVTMSEPFPELSGAPSKNTNSDNIRLRRRKSSGIGQNIAGDVNVPSFATGRSGTPPPLNSPANVAGDMAVCTCTPPLCGRVLTRHHRQTRQAGAPNVAPCAARSPSSSASASGTHGSARSSSRSSSSRYTSCTHTPRIRSQPASSSHTPSIAVIPSSPPMSAPTRPHHSTMARAHATSLLLDSTSSC